MNCFRNLPHLILWNDCIKLAYLFSSALYKERTVPLQLILKGLQCSSAWGRSMQALSASKTLNMIEGTDCNLKRTELSPTSQDKQSQICQYVAKTHLCDCSLPEQWKELRDHPLYFLCSDGNVVSCMSSTKWGPHLLKPYYNKKNVVWVTVLAWKQKSTA